MASNIFNFLSDEVYNQKMNVKNNLLRILAENESDNLIPKSWDYIQFLVRNDLHKKVLHLGDELVCQKDGVNISWIIVDFDKDIPIDSQFTHSLTLVMKNQWNEAVQFDSKEAAFYFEDGLSAGTYYFTIGAQPWCTEDVNKSFMFTITTAIPAKGQLVFGNNYAATCENARIYSYSSSSFTSPLEDVADNVSSPSGKTMTMTLWDGETGIFLGTINNDVQTNINSIQRALLGNTNYKESAIRQWLTSDAVAGSVWKPQTKFDRPPSWKDTLKGFMNGMDEDFLSVIKPTLITTARSTSTDGGGVDITQDKIFLLSKPQVYGGATVSGVDEGAPYEYFLRYSDLSAAGSGSDKNRIKTRNGSAQWYWLRSRYAGIGTRVWIVNIDGQLGNSYAANAHGVAAACTIY